MTFRTHGWLICAVVGLICAPIVLITQDALLSDALWVAMTGCAASAVAAGIVVHRPRQPLAWWLLVTSLSAFTIAVALEAVSERLVGSAELGMAANAVNTCGYILLGVVALNLVRHQTPRGDRDSLIDALIVMMSLTTVLWSVTFGTDPMAADIPLLSRGFFVISLLIPGGVTALCLRLLSTSGRHNLSATMLGSAGIAMFMATMAWAVDLAGIAQVSADVMDILWLIATFAAPAAALHPSMRRLTHQAESAPDSVPLGRLVVLGLALLATPAALLHATGAVDENIVLPVGGSALLSVLVLARLARLVGDREQARREVVIQAAHQSALSDLAADALTGGNVSELFAAATTALRANVGASAVRIVPREGAASEPPKNADQLYLPITGLDGPVADIEVAPPARASLTTDGCQFLRAVANILGAAVQRRQAERALEHRATHDTLTGLPNRAQLFDRLERALLRRSAATIGVLFIDLDGFKPINDEHGHQVGDQLLVAVSSRMSREVRVGDTVARLSGDEFVIILDPCTRAELSEIATRILACIAAHFPVEQGSVSVTASIGGTLTTDADWDPESVLRRVDRAMYQAKESRDLSIVIVDGTDEPSEPGNSHPTPSR